jgi:hypothetical protein
MELRQHYSIGYMAEVLLGVLDAEDIGEYRERYREEIIKFQYWLSCEQFSRHEVNVRLKMFFRPCKSLMVLLSTLTHSTKKNKLPRKFGILSVNFALILQTTEGSSLITVTATTMVKRSQPGLLNQRLIKLLASVWSKNSRCAGQRKERIYYFK